MRRGLANSRRGAVQAMTLALWVLCALVAVASPAKRPVKGHAVRAQESTGKTAKSKKKPQAKAHGKTAPKSSAKSSKSKTRRPRPKVDEADYEAPTVHRTRATVAARPAAISRAAASLPAMPTTGAAKRTYVGTATGTVAPPLPSAYSQ